MSQTQQQERDDEEDSILLTLAGIRPDIQLHDGGLEKRIASALQVATDRISVVDIMDVEADPTTTGSGSGVQVMFAVFPDADPSNPKCTAAQFADQMNEFLQQRSSCSADTDNDDEWLVRTSTSTSTGVGTGTTAARCSVAEMEEEVEIEEEEAFRIWHDMPEESRTSHLSLVPSPDGAMIQPCHDNLTTTWNKDNNANDNNTAHVAKETQHASTSSSSSIIEAQIKRDPSLLELDNVRRISISQIKDEQSHQDNALWNEPLIITGCCDNYYGYLQLLQQHLSKNTLTHEPQFANVSVRTGNRNTLMENGYDNSIPMNLRLALLDDGNNDNDKDTTTKLEECGRIVFSPIKELPEFFHTILHPVSVVFPPFPPTPSERHGDANDNCDNPNLEQQRTATADQKYTLCISGREGFGIGFHKHNAAFFLLLVGRKKWYMAASSPPLEEPTHPEFYTTKSSHKCIQQPGEILYVPDEWYHEIFNLEYTAGIQALPDVWWERIQHSRRSQAWRYCSKARSCNAFLERIIGPEWAIHLNGAPDFLFEDKSTVGQFAFGRGFR